jgi:hypothetical protein
MQAHMKQTPIGQRQPLKGLAWFVAVAYLFLAPFKFSPVGVLGWPSYYVKFVQWGYPAWVSPVVGGVEMVAAVLLLLPRRRSSPRRDTGAPHDGRGDDAHCRS